MGVRVTGDIAGRGARVRVEQRFRNGEARAVEAVYRFPLPEGAAVCGFEARVGERTIRGRVEEREKAFEAYDQALAEGHGGFLLDEERPNLFALSVGNLAPGAEVGVRIDYVTLLDVERGVARFLLPTTIAPRYLPDPEAEEEGLPVDERLRPPYAGRVPYGLSLELRLHGADSLASIESPSHAIRVEPGGEPAPGEPLGGLGADGPGLRARPGPPGRGARPGLAGSRPAGRVPAARPLAAGGDGGGGRPPGDPLPAGLLRLDAGQLHRGGAPRPGRSA